MNNYLVCAILMGSILGVYSGECALSLHGNSYITLSDSTQLFTKANRAQYTFQLWFSPSQHVAHEQNLLQTGIAEDEQGFWAVEIKFKTTIWSRSERTPAGSVLSVDTYSKAVGADWIRTRYYTVLGGDSFPWAHISFDAVSNTISINREEKRVDKQTSKSGRYFPRVDFALGEGLNGIIDDVRIYSSARDDSTIQSTLCPEDAGQLELYIPFSECGGDILSASTHGNAVCPVLHGNDNSWTQPSPISASKCAEQDVVTDKCSEAKQASRMLNSPLFNGAYSSRYMIPSLVGLSGVIACAALFFTLRKVTSLDSSPIASAV